MASLTDPPAELDRIVNGPVPAELRDRLMAALTAYAGPVAGDPAHRGHRARQTLRRLAETLPPVQETLHDPNLLAALSACAAVADPPMYMTALSHYTLCLRSIISLAGDTKELQPQLDALEEGRSKGVYLVTEVGDADSHLGIRTTARFDSERREFILTTPDPGAMKFSGVSALGGPQTAVVCARVQVAGADRGVFSFTVDLCDEQGPMPGVSISSRLEVSSLPLDYALVRFDDLRLPYERWLRDNAHIDETGGFHDPLDDPDARLQRTLCVGQALWGTLPTAMAAMARECSVLALRHSSHRRAHGRLAPGAPVLTYTTQRHALLGALAEAFALTCVGNTARDTWWRSMSGPGDPLLEGGTATGMTFSPWAAVDRPLAVYKALSARAVARLAAECQHRCGFAGFLGVNRLAAYQGFAHAFDSAGGDSQLILLDAGRSLAEEPGHGVTDAAPPPDTTAHDPAWWPAVTRAQEGRLTAALRKRLHERTSLGLRGLELWNPLLNGARELGEAHASRLAAESLSRTLDTVRDPGLLAALRPLASMYGAVEARRLSGGLLSTGVLSTETVCALPALMDQLCDRLMPYLHMLEASMGSARTRTLIPLGAPDYARALTDSLSWYTHRKGSS